MDFPSFTQLFEIARNEALIRSPPLSQSAIDREGSDANILVAAACAAADEVIAQLVNTTAGLFLDSAQGTALDRLLFDRYGLTRKIASNAVGSVNFTTLVPAAADFTILAGTKLTTTSGATFETTADVLFPLGSSGPITAQVRSLLAGADQQAKANTITSITGTIANAPASLTVTNPQATAGAADRETDAEFRERGRAYFTTLQRGTLSAIEQGALAVPGVVRANAYELLDELGRPNREVSLIIADKFTDTLANYGSVPPTYEIQSSAKAEEVFRALNDYRPAGIFVRVQMAQVRLQPITLALSFEAGVDTTEVTNNARAAVVNVINNLNPGDTLSISDLVLALRAVTGLIVTESDLLNPTQIIISPSGNVIPTPLEVLRTSITLVRSTSCSS